MITDKQTDLVYFSSLLSTKDEYKDFWNRLEPILIEQQINYKLLENTKDIWCRDYMPIQISDNKFVEYRYDPDYLQAKKHRQLKTYSDIISEQIKLKGIIKTDLIIDGGNVIKSENCAILTEKVIIENKPIYKREQTIKILKELFKVDKIIIIPWDKDDIYGHADGMIRFIDNKSVLLNWYIELDECKYKGELLKVLQENDLQWKFLNFDATIETENNNWAYINYLQTKDIIIVPKFNINEDSKVFDNFNKYFPEYAAKNKIIQIDCREIVKNGGALNCITWNIKTNMEIYTLAEFKTQIKHIDWQRLFTLIPKLKEDDSKNIEDEFLKCVYEINIVINFDWMNWEKGAKIYDSRDFDISECTLIDLCKFITVFVRNDRFCDDFLLSEIQNKKVLKVVEKIKYLIDNEKY